MYNFVIDLSFPVGKRQIPLGPIEIFNIDFLEAKELTLAFNSRDIDFFGWSDESESDIWDRFWIEVDSLGDEWFNVLLEDVLEELDWRMRTLD